MNSRIRNDRPNVGIQNERPTVHTTSFQTGKTGTVIDTGTDTSISIGTPIGLLLVLTYAEAQGVTAAPVAAWGERPNSFVQTA